MDPNWANALIGAASFLTLLTSFLIGFLFRLSKELSEFKAYVANYHATKEEMNSLADRLERQIETGFDRIYDLIKERKAA